MSETIEVKTIDLIGPALDWAIAQVETIPIAIASPHYGTGWRIYKPDFGGKYSPSTDWGQGGQLIEKHQIELEWARVDGKALWWRAEHQDIVHFQIGDTPLIAACRAIVAKLGDTVRIPAELAPLNHP